MAPFKDFVFGIFTSGKFTDRRNESDMEMVVRYVVLNVALMMGGLFLFGYGITLLFEGYFTRALLDFIFTLFCLITFILLRTKMPLFVSGLIPLVPFAAYLVYLVYVGDLQGYTGLWIYTYPLMSIFVLGLLTGTILSILLFALVAASVFIPGFAVFEYGPEIAARICTIYFMVLVFTIVYEMIRRAKDRWAGKLTSDLQTERDEIAAMKDNLRVGVFLMDHDFIIQPSYSVSMETVLAARQLQGRSFVDILSASVKARELEAIQDYFGMVINRQFDQAMLDDINPLRELRYKSPETGEERIIDCGFAPLIRQEGKAYILGTLQDITAQQQLRIQLAEEESKRQEAMRSLFEIIQVEPKIFNDFVEDSEYEFERVNEILKDRRVSTADAMLEIYQSVHAIKSNALILGLDGFSKKLHSLEDKIKNLREQADISFDDVLHITVELEQIMREKDKYRETIDRILAFRGGSSKQNRQILVDNLAKICQRAASDLNKQVRFVAREIDNGALQTSLRRPIKEILTQLVRNSVVHGIEDPASRLKEGKTAEGLINLCITVDDGKVHIRLKDDGKGLDFDVIRQRALEMNLLSETDSHDKNLLLRTLFSPGFSTAADVDVHAGRGVGLSLVQGRLRELRGRIRVNTRQGKGTTFHIFIPLEADEAV